MHQVLICFITFLLVVSNTGVVCVLYCSVALTLAFKTSTLKVVSGDTVANVSFCISNKNEIGKQTWVKLYNFHGKTLLYSSCSCRTIKLPVKKGFKKSLYSLFSSRRIKPVIIILLSNQLPGCCYMYVTLKKKSSHSNLERWLTNNLFCSLNSHWPH